jgi:hypothetical protein
MSEFQITYASLADMRQALHQVRGNRFYHPRYQWIVEAIRIMLLVMPIILNAAGLISDQALFSFIIGFLAMSIFERRLKPLIYKKFAPHFDLASVTAWPMQIVLAPSGLHITTSASQSRLAWAALPLPELRKNGILIRIEPERSLPIKSIDLPQGMTARDLLNSIQQWRAAP